MKNNKKILNILVSGGSGFLGSHLIDTLVNSGHNVCNYDTIKSIYNSKNINSIVGDLLDLNSLTNALKGVDVVYHLAAYADLDKAKKKPLKTMSVNVLGTANLLEAARINNVKQVIFASTIYVHSRTGGFYRVSKHACELLLEEYHNTFGLNYTILRFGTLYGPRSGSSNSVYNYLKAALKDKHIRAIGTGGEVREYIDVRDASLVCEKVMNTQYNGETIVVTGNHRMRISELLEMISEILNDKVTIEYCKGKAAHYKYTPYSYNPRPGKKLVLDSFRDIGQGLVEMLEEIDN